MSWEELKSQVESAVRRLFQAHRTRERDALEFVLALLRRCVLEECSLQEEHAVEQDVKDIPEGQKSEEDKLSIDHDRSTMVDERADSPEASDFHNSPPPSPKQSLPPPSPKPESLPKRRSKRKRNPPEPAKTSEALQGLSTSYTLLMREIRNKKRSYVHCFVCTDWAAPRAHLLRHVASHAGAPASCRTCRHSFSNLAALTLHRDLAACAAAPRPPRHPPDFPSVGADRLRALDFARFAVCPFCGARFFKPPNLRAHMRSGTCSRPSARLKCALCIQTFVTQELLTEHRNRVHSHKCSRCEEVFPTALLMKAHRRTECPVSRKVHKCSDCSQSLSSRKELRAHRKDAHSSNASAQPTNEKKLGRHLCGACGWRTSRAYNLARHACAHAHAAPGAPPPPPPAQHACHRCPAILRSAASLHNHLAAHTQERLFVCADCDAGFRYKGTLRRHVARHAARGARHACARCPRSFLRRDNLARHQREYHERRRKQRVRESEARRGDVEARGQAAAAPPGQQEPQFLSLLDVQSGEMFTVPSHLAYNLLIEEPRAEWARDAGVLPPAANIVLLTNVPDLLQPAA